MCRDWTISIRRACGARDFDRSTYWNAVSVIFAKRARDGYRRVHVLLEREGWSANINPSQMVSDRVGCDAHGLGNFREVHSFRPKPIGRAGDLERRRETANGVRLPVKQLAKASGLSIRPPPLTPIRTWQLLRYRRCGAGWPCRPLLFDRLRRFDVCLYLAAIGHLFGGDLACMGSANMRASSSARSDDTGGAGRSAWSGSCCS